MWWNGKYAWGISVTYLSTMVVMRNSTCVKTWVVNWCSHSFDITSFLLKRMIDKLRLCSLEYLAHISFKMNYCKWAYNFKENNLVFVDNKKIQAFNKNYFGKLMPNTKSLTISYYLRLFWWASLIVLRLRIYLPIRGTWVPSLVGELRSHMPWATKLAQATTEPTCCS